MPKYILNTKGKIVERGNPNSVKDATELAGEYTGKAGSYHEDKIDNYSNVNLPFTTLVTDSSNDEKEHTIGSVTPRFSTLQNDEEDIFPERKDNNFLINPSFGADKPVKFHKNFNDYLNVSNFLPDDRQNKIFADELEMIAGLEFNSFGLTDLSRFLFVFDYIFESIAYILIIETILMLAPESEEINYKQRSNYTSHNFELQLGSSGPVSYDVLSRFIKQVLQYPSDRRSEGAQERIGAYFVGLSLYINSDPKFFISFYKKTANTTIVSPLTEIIFYFMESILSLSKIGQNRLFMLIRKFHQKADWHKNVLYNAKSNSPENVVDKFIVELNYYYVKFVIERINVGLKLKYKQKNKIRNKLNRSGKLKDSRGDNYFSTIVQNTSDYRKIEIKQNKPTGIESNRQSTSIHALPQSFILPESFRRSYYVKSGSDLSILHMNEKINSYFLKTKKPQERLSPQSVAEMEEFYETEMMPFYFQDLRTNEIIGFHAFVDSIVDNFNPNYNPTKGFGRIDAIQHYVDTTRNVNITFTLAAMSPEDHDLMWYQINKIVSMCYPQWSEGFKKKSINDEGVVKNDPNGKVFPFTQVPTASPLIRIRLGDVIKSNYTKHAIEKIHGSSSKPKEITELPESEQAFDFKFFVNKGTYKLEKKDQILNRTDITIKGKQEVSISQYSIRSESSESEEDDDENPRILDAFITDPNNIERGANYIAILKDPVINSLLTPPGSKTTGFIVKGKDITKDKSRNTSGDNAKLLKLNKEAKEPHRKVFNNYTKAYDDSGNVNNPVTAAYETTLGKGLAGFITMLDVNYNEQLWETGVVGSKAPKLVKLNISFAPIHDIPPGLDADGAMRAPVYNTGNIIHTMYGNVYDKKDVKNRD